MSSAPARQNAAPVLLVAVAATLVPLLYALYADHIWEDYFITYRFSHNLREGWGLVYSPGERVHGFTSPLGVLLPGLFSALAPADDYRSPLWLFRLVSMAAFAGGGVLLYRKARVEGDGARGPALFLALLYLLHANAVEFATDGMETAFMLLFVAWDVSLFGEGRPRRWVSGGLAWAGLMWTRPDGCVYIAVSAAANLAFARGSRRELARSFVKGAAVCTALYLPWFAWAWWYYGSPVPHTIIAKANLDQRPSGLRALLPHYWHVAALAFQPIYYQEWNGWYPGLVPVTRALGAFCAMYWLVPVRDSLGRMASFCFALLCLYLALLKTNFPWYLPPVALFGLIALARGVFALAEAARRQLPALRLVAPVVLAAVVLERAVLLGLTAVQMKIAQDVVEMGNRLPIGLWLKTRVQPGEGVYLEPIGYIGYFSGAKILDWPGLVTPSVARLARRYGLDFYSVPRALQPAWMVLRPFEATRMLRDPALRARYRRVATFDNRRGLDRYRLIPAKNYLLHDCTFIVFRRRPSS